MSTNTTSHPSYYARRWRTLYSPDALDFTPRAPRPALVPVYTSAPAGIYSGLPRAARAAHNPRAAWLVPAVAVAGGLALYLQNSRRVNARDGIAQMLNTQANNSQREVEMQRRKALADAYGDRASLERLEEAARVYETNQV